MKIAKFIFSIAVNTIFFTGIWYAICRFSHIPSYILPSPQNVLVYTTSHWSLVLYNSLITLMEAFLGILIAVILTLLMGISSIYFSYLFKAFYRLLLVVQIIPLIAIAPLVITWLGFSVSSKVMVVAIVALFPILTSFLNGLHHNSVAFVEVLKTMGASPFDIFRKVQLPNGCLGLFSGLKIAVTYSVSSAIVAEYLGAEHGIGIFLTRALSSFNTDALFTNVVAVVVITIIFYQLVCLLQYWFTPWQRVTTLNTKG